MSKPLRSIAALLPGAALLASTAPAAAAATLTLVSDSALRFGSFVVAGSGSRTVSATGAVTDSNVFPVGGSGTAPAQFTLRYDRGTPAFFPITVTVMMVLPTVGAIAQNGITGTLSSFDSDLAGIPLFIPGQSVVFTMANCTTQVCSRTFHVGGKIAVTQPGAGGTVTVPLAMTATLLAAL